MSRESMNMGSSNSNIISQLKATMSELQQGFSSMRHEASSFFTSLNRPSNMVGGVAGGNVHPNQVAPNPIFSSAPGVIGMTESGNIVAAGPSASMSAGSGFSQPAMPGMENLSQYVAAHPGSGTIYTPASMTSGTTGLSNMAQSAPYDPAASAIDTALQTGAKNTSLISGLLNKLGGGSSLLGALNGFGMVSSLLPGTDETVQADLLMKRIGFFTKGYQSNLLGTDSQGNALTSGAMANLLASQGTTTSSLDSLNALAAAQSMGLMGGGSAFLSGVANVSNLTPGMGIEGSMRATGAMQQASSVNMLRGIGIQLRDANGNMTAPDKVIDDVWDKICKDFGQAYKGAKPTLQQVQIALQPGNSLDSMLNQYFGGDPMLKTMVMNGLLYRAQSGSTTISGAGGVPAPTESQNILQAATTTSAVSSLSQRFAATTDLLTANAPEGAGGFKTANDIISGFISTFGSALAATLLPVKTFTDTLLSASGGAPTNIIASLAALFKADGGPVQGGTAYIVGERGPELFVPGVSGMIVPNEQIQPNQNKNSGTISGASNSTYNFNINIPNANTPEVIAALRKLLSDLETNKIVSES